MGSTGKTAQARAVHLLTRVPPKEVDGRDVLRWEVRKASFAKSGHAFGVEVERDLNDEGRPLGVTLTPYDLPDEELGDTRGARAVAAVVAHLEGSGGATVAHAALLALAVERGNLRERAAHEAVGRALGQMWDRLEMVKQPGQGAPKAYRLKLAPDGHCHTATNSLDTVQDGVLFVTAPLCQSSQTATNTGP